MFHFGEMNQPSPPPFPPLLNVVVYWQSSNTEACVKKLSQMLANNIDNLRYSRLSVF